MLLLGAVAAGCVLPSSSPLATDRVGVTTVPCGWTEQVDLTGIASLRDVLPNTRFRVRGSKEPARPLTPLVVVGEVVGVAPGPGWTESGDRVGFDDDAALWKQVHATVAVEEVIGSAGWTADTVTVAFPLHPSEPLEEAGRVLAGTGRMVLPLRREDGARDAADVWSVGPAAAVLLAQVGPEGRLALPCVPPRRATRLLIDVPTLADLRQAATAPVRVKVVRATAAR